MALLLAVSSLALTHRLAPCFGVGTACIAAIRPVHSLRVSTAARMMSADASIPIDVDATAEADEQPHASWRERVPDRAVLLRIVAVVAITAAYRPMLVAQVAYAACGVGVGYGSTKLFRFAASPEARERLAALGARASAFANEHLNPRAKLRAALLRFDPSLEEDEGASIGFSDLRGPLRGGKKKKGGWRPAPPWKRNADA